MRTPAKGASGFNLFTGQLPLGRTAIGVTDHELDGNSGHQSTEENDANGFDPSASLLHDEHNV
jgi:hypothetical protein